MGKSLNKKCTAGFTLLEVLIYLALFSVLMSGGVSLVYQLLRSSAATEHALAIESEGNFIAAKLQWALSNSATVTFPDAQSLRIDRQNIDIDDPLQFTAQDGVWYLTRGHETPVALTSSQIHVHDVQMRQSGSTITIIYWLDEQSFVITNPLYE